LAICLSADIRLDYNPGVDTSRDFAATSGHDATLIDWFLKLDPGQRLAELESRLDFIASVRRHDKLELPPDTRTP
jgi:hypothetical protein